MNTDITFDTTEGRFNLRVCAVILKEGRLLAMKDERSPYYYLPGGRIKMNERAEDAILREIREELGIGARIVRPLWLNQAFFNEDVNHLDYHELCLYFLTEIDAEGTDAFTRTEGRQTLRFEWLPVDDLKDAYLYPLFIKEAIHHLPDALTLRSEFE